MVLENRHTHPKEIENFNGAGGGVGGLGKGVSKAKIFKGKKYGLKLKFPERRNIQTKNTSVGFDWQRF